jgi:hypothetical protein
MNKQYHMRDAELADEKSWFTATRLILERHVVH